MFKEIRKQLKELFFPEISAQALADLDQYNLNNLYTLSTVIMICELFTLAIFIATTRSFGHDAMVSIASVGFCIVVCFSGRLISKQLLKKQTVSHGVILTLCVAYFILMSVWAVVVSFRHYAAGSQMLTFYAFVLAFACFIVYHPLVSCALVALLFGGTYMAFLSRYWVDGLNLFNYIFFALVCLFAMIVHFSRELKISANTEALEQKNEQLRHVSRHDGLTGLNNRASFAEDFPLWMNKQLVVIMSDIDYFKNFNDTYGHVVGDMVIGATGRHVTSIFPNGRAYRYGGDEFLVLIENGNEEEVKAICEAHRSFVMPKEQGGFSVNTSYGVASGMAVDEVSLTALISEADHRLYEIKQQIHKDDGPARP